MEDLFIGYLEDKYYKKIRKSDKPVECSWITPFWQ